MKKVTRISIVLAAAIAIAAASSVLAQDHAAPAAAARKTSPGKSAPVKASVHTTLNPSDMQWMDAPPFLAPGSKLAVLFGDPSKPGLYILRVKAGDGYRIANHWHPTDEHVTVIAGTFLVSAGDSTDVSKEMSLSAGGFATMPAKMHHAAKFGGDTEIEVSGMGPFQINYVDPADDPRKSH